MKIKVLPFVKWLGGKTLIADSIIKHMPKDFNNYYEPFVGGCGFIFRLINKNIIQPSSKVILSDNNAELINLYEVVRDQLEDLITLLDIHQANNTAEYFYQIRELDRHPTTYDKLSKVEKAARFLYLNKVCYNGLMRYNSKGQYNTPYGSYKQPVIYIKEVLENAREIFKQVTIRHEDYKQALSSVSKNDFVYLDPPYHPISKSSNFTKYSKDGFTEQDQRDLHNIFVKLKQQQVNVIESNSNTDFIKQLYQDYTIQKINAPRLINRTTVQELIIY